MNISCYFCHTEIKPTDAVNHHHTVYKSLGGTRTAAAHQSCHVAHHSNSGDFKAWGKVGGQISALSKQWAFNLKNVRTDPLYEQARAFNRAMYAN
jgi:hypothetical protein